MRKIRGPWTEGMMGMAEMEVAVEALVASSKADGVAFGLLIVGPDYFRSEPIGFAELVWHRWLTKDETVTAHADEDRGLGAITGVRPPVYLPNGFFLVTDALAKRVAKFLKKAGM